MSYMSELDAETRQEYLSDVSTEELIADLVSREWVKRYAIKDGESYLIQKRGEFGTLTLENGSVPVTIITVDGES